MDFSLRKLKLMEWLEELQDESLIKKIEKLRSQSDSHTSATFVPMSREELIRRAMKAEEDIQTGRLFSPEEIEKESENW